MRLVSIEENGQPAIGITDGTSVVPLAAIAPDLPQEMNQFIAAGKTALDAAASQGVSYVRPL